MILSDEYSALTATKSPLILNSPRSLSPSSTVPRSVKKICGRLKMELTFQFGFQDTNSCGHTLRFPLFIFTCFMVGYCLILSEYYNRYRCVRASHLSVEHSELKFIGIVCSILLSLQDTNFQDRCFQTEIHETVTENRVR